MYLAGRRRKKKRKHRYEKSPQTSEETELMSVQHLPSLTASPTNMAAVYPGIMRRFFCSTENADYITTNDTLA